MEAGGESLAASMAAMENGSDCGHDNHDERRISVTEDDDRYRECDCKRADGFANKAINAATQSGKSIQY